jgi:hypothetical protein
LVISTTSIVVSNWQHSVIFLGLNLQKKIFYFAFRLDFIKKLSVFFEIKPDSKVLTDVMQEGILKPQNFKNIGVSVKIKGSLSQVMQR